MLRRQQDAVQCQVVEKQSLHCLPSDPNIRKEWMKFIFNKDPDRVSKDCLLFTSFYCEFIYKQGTIRCVIFKKTELNVDAVPTIFDLTVMSQHK